MEIGNEISQKIRSAIKAKLVDLGAYVDDELPDYIMVMVANKKTKEQMTDDLNLFLGNNTEKFTSWLTALLDKLQTLSSESTAVSRGEEKTPSTTVPVTSAKKADSKPEVTGDSIQSQPNKKNEKATTEVSNYSKRTSSEIDTAGEPPKKRFVSDTKDEIKHSTMKDIEIEITPARDELDDVTEELPKRSHLTQSSGTSQPSKAVKPTPQAKVATSPHSEAKTKSGSKSIHSKAEKDTGHTDVASRLGSVQAGVKRKSLTSAIGAIVKHAQAEEEEDEEYDPHKPFIGNVASVVKVSERKSKVPAAWQADKSILLKAISDARDSIEKRRKTEKAIVHPTIQRPSSSREQRKDVHKRIGQRVSGSHTSALHSDRLQRRHSPVYVERSSANGDSHIKTHRVSSEDAKKRSERSIQVFQKVKEENKDVFDHLKSKISARKRVLHITDTNKSSGDDETKIKEDNVDTSMSDDCRLIEYDPEEYTKVKYAVPQYKGSLSSVQSTLVTLVESGAEESDFTDGEGDDNRVIETREQEHSEVLTRSGPKFVVTLDGVDPALLRTDVNSDSDIEMDDVSKLESNVVRVEPQILAPPQIEPVTVNLGPDEDGGHEEDKTKQFKSTERCRFFPGCKNGDACPFYHPKEPCSKFPHCKFGDQCLFIHPLCKYDSSCLRPDCIFAHTTKRPTSQLAQSLPVVIQPVKVPVFYQGVRPTKPAGVNKRPADITCKFYPKCTNMNCPFNHPMPCRFGIACKNKTNCRFTHPKLPSKKELSWMSKDKPTSKVEEENNKEMKEKTQSQ